MYNTYYIVGYVVCGIGGILVGVFLLSFAGGIACMGWIALSEKFRDVCRGESLIFEYRKNRQMFLLWKEYEAARNEREAFLMSDEYREERESDEQH